MSTLHAFYVKKGRVVADNLSALQPRNASKKACCGKRISRVAKAIAWAENKFKSKQEQALTESFYNPVTEGYDRIYNGLHGKLRITRTSGSPIYKPHYCACCRKVFKQSWLYISNYGLIHLCSTCKSNV